MSKLAKFALPLLLATLLILSPLQSILAAPAWLGSWAYRVKLTVDNTDIDGALSDFPILLYISASSGRNSEDITFVFDELTADANRKKIAVTTDDEVTQCYVEIEKWDDANEEAWLWVKAPAIASGTDQDFYLYYDVSQADNDTYVGDTNDAVAENVWDANFKAVYHMRDGSDTSHIYDSTSNDHDGTKQAANEPQITTSSEIDGAQDFDGTADYITITDHADFDFVTAITMEAWAKFDNIPLGNEIAIGKEACYRGVVSSDLDASHACIRVFTGASWKGILTNTVLVAGTQFYYAGTYDKSHLKVYYNGALDCTPAAETGDMATSAADLCLGDYTTAGGYDIDGILDEVRLSSNARNADWIKASYETQRDDLLDWGGEEAASPPDAPTAFTITQTGAEEVTITWTTGTGATTTIVRGKHDSYPTSYTDGWAVYDGALETDTDTLIDSTLKATHYRAWSHNAVGYSTDYTEGKIGGKGMVLLALLGMAAIVSYLSVRSSFYPLKIAASFCWWGFLAYWLNAEHLTRGSAADTAIILTLIFIGLLFMIWALYTRRGTVDIESEVSGSGSILRRISRYTTPRREPTQERETTAEYKDRIRRALGSKKRRR